VDRDGAYSNHLAYINAANHAILKVDNNSTVKAGERRNSVRLTSVDSYAVGSLWIIDLVHLPYGCSVRLFLVPVGFSVAYGGTIGMACVLDHGSEMAG
jgi:hypothetical protein